MNLDSILFLTNIIIDLTIANVYTVLIFQIFSVHNIYRVMAYQIATCIITFNELEKQDMLDRWKINKLNKWHILHLFSPNMWDPLTVAIDHWNDRYINK